MSYADVDDLTDAYEGDLSQVRPSRVQYLLDTAGARLNMLVPGLAERVTGSDDLRLLARDVVVQAVLRQVRNPSPEFVQQSETAGPFSHSMNVGTGNSRGNRGLFYQEELDLLMPVQTGQRTGTIFLGLSDWGARR